MQLYNIRFSLFEPIRSELVQVGRRRAVKRAATRRSAQLVLSSVPRKARLVFAEFIRAVLARPDEPGVPTSALYQSCHAKFYVHSTAELHVQLVEFRTHNLVGATGSGISETLTTTLPKAALRELLRDIDEMNNAAGAEIEN